MCVEGNKWEMAKGPLIYGLIIIAVDTKYMSRVFFMWFSKFKLIYLLKYNLNKTLIDVICLLLFFSYQHLLIYLLLSAFCLLILFVVPAVSKLGRKIKTGGICKVNYEKNEEDILKRMKRKLTLFRFDFHSRLNSIST